MGLTPENAKRAREQQLANIRRIYGTQAAASKVTAAPSRMVTPFSAMVVSGA